ncbi:hypothetical protein F5Y14DRAFT_447666 [Nemania sp. NC0429]|nr:hypothetical protein F5Y14DRAFT_447666 [Nemania sp. NC0429]
MSKLPIKVRLGIRDSWDSASAPVQAAIRGLQDVTGVRVTVNPEWPLLYAELGAFHPDAATLVPSVAVAVGACCTALGALADDEANADWADTLLERTGNHIRIIVEVSKSREISLTWSAQQPGIIISLPKASVPPQSQSHLSSFFAGALLTLFDGTQQVRPEEDPSSISPPGEATPTPTPTQDDWAHISLDTKTGTAAATEIIESSRASPSPPLTTTTRPQARGVPAPAPTPTFPSFDILPAIEAVPRPDDLLQRPPYHLLVHGASRTRVEVQCSHSPTLRFLAEYLRKWARTNHNDTRRPPCADVTLHQSAFGLGLMYDRLTLGSDGRHAAQAQAVSPTLVLALVEGVLGYRAVSQQGEGGGGGGGGGSSWAFRRDVEFRSGQY